VVVVADRIDLHGVAHVADGGHICGASAGRAIERSDQRVVVLGRLEFVRGRAEADVVLRHCKEGFVR